ncbi:zwei Ig domain protein zig-8 [Megalopta genalis]|uniref:zwei Ig domain protein zig-8 n=1 Tax=Megalopta genalis TaxID=115081 RepID=UPI001443130A|nr:protein amalgam-like [Megalopta genalis]XP_033333311.1 protein amalgam-like [Megalopta genalis]XP_033333313.1 protein amalgam-like [Megalopta genalis]XP_033333314.1 protein amalgam-like [Megalopta genalis]
MNRKRWTVRALRMDLRCGASGTGCCTPAKIICIFLLAILMHEEAVRSNRLFEADTSETRQPSDSEPYFDTTISSNVTGLVGETVQLVCKVKNLGNRTVAWVRHRDIHLLTAGVFTYTSDQRFTAVHVPHTEDWILRISFAQKKDTGTYECQLSNTPPISRHFHLTVVEPVTEIAGGPDFFINKGSTINLTCLVSYAPEPPSAIIWSHNHETINFETPRGGISLVTERGPVTSSRLLIQRATKEDSGLYTCAPGMMHPASARVHIVNEHPAAMHHGHGDRISAGLITMVLLLSVVI